MFTLDEAQQKMERVLDQYPDLYPDGFHRSQNDHSRLLGRQLMLHPVALSRFSNACAWLSLAKKRKSANRELGTSYRLKHQIQSIDANKPGEDDYTTEGEFIAALIASGVFIERYKHGVYAGLSSKCPIFGKSQWREKQQRPHPKLTWSSELDEEYITLLHEYHESKLDKGTVTKNS